MLKLVIPPIQSSYATNSVGARSVILDGPRSRYVKEKEMAPIMLSLTWIVDGLGFQYLRSFYRGGTTKGAEPFNIDLITNSSNIETLIAFFVPGTFSLMSKTGPVFTVTAQLDVLPTVKNASYEYDLFVLQQIYGDRVSNILNLFNQIVNVEWPVA